MSLIIASHYENIITILSDTKLTYSADKAESLRENHYNLGVIKVKFITENIVVAFAGESRDAEKAYKAIDNLNNLDEICNELLSIHMLYEEPRIDFIVAFNCGNVKELISIKCKKITRNVKKAFIGDAEAYKSYSNNEIYEPVKNALNVLNNDRRQQQIQNEMKLMQNYFCIAQTNIGEKNINIASFKSIINNPKYNTIGGIFINLQSVNDTFEFLGYTENINFRDQYIPINTSQAINLGNAQTGACCTNVFQSEQNCVAVHLHEANLGIIFEEDNELMMTAKYYKDHNIIKFQRFVESSYSSVKLLFSKGVSFDTHLKELSDNINNFNEKYAKEDLEDVRKLLLKYGTEKINDNFELDDYQNWKLLDIYWNIRYLYFLYYDSVYNDNICNFDAFIKDSELLLMMSTHLISNNINSKQKQVITDIIKNMIFNLNKNNCNSTTLINAYWQVDNFLKSN